MQLQLVVVLEPLTSKLRQRTIQTSMSITPIIPVEHYARVKPITSPITLTQPVQTRFSVGWTI